MEKQEILLTYEDTRGWSPKSRYEKLVACLKGYEDTDLLKLPLLMLEETAFKKKERYYEITKVWTESDCKAESWVLLSLVDTIEEMSSMIFETYKELVGLFRTLLSEYLETRPKTDVLAALAILKACELELISPERYTQIGTAFMGHSGSALEQRLEVYACERLEAVNHMWGEF